MKNQISKHLALSISIVILALVNYSCEPPTEAETTGDIQGVIYDATNTQPLSGATITTEPTTSSKITDTNGSFLIEGIEPGDYSLQVSKTGYQTNTTTVKVIAGETASADLQLSPVEPQLSVSTTDLDFSASSTSIPFTISNSGEGTLDWTVSENSNWISVNPTSGSITSNQSSVTVSVDRSGLSAGVYSESISVSSNGGSATITVTMTVEGPVLILSNNSLNFGTSSTNLTFTVTNGGIGTLTYNVVYSANWLTATPSTGSATTETDVITLTVNRDGLAYGNYFETITITSNSNSATVDVLMTVADPNNPQLSAYPTSLDFGESSIEESYYVTNTGSGVLTWNVTDDKSWISVTPQSGTTETETDELTVNIDRLGQDPGTYTGTITITSDGGNQNINVSMTIPDEPSLSVTPNSLEFGETTTSLPITVVNAGTGELNWSISDNQEWISVNPTSGTNYSSVNVSIDRAGMSPGDYSGLVSISSNGGTASVAVNMNVPADEPPTAVILSDPSSITTSSMKLSWEMNTDNDFVNYSLFRSTESSVTESSELVAEIVNRYTLEYIDEGLQDGTTFYYRVFVEDAIGQTTGSNTVSATTLNQPGTWGVFATAAESIDLYGVSALSGDFAYFVGDSGKIYKWDGAELSEEESPTTERLYGVSILSDTSIFISGIEGVWKYSDAFWEQSGTMPVAACRGIESLGENSIWVGDEDGDIYHFNGSTWLTQTVASDPISDIHIRNEQSGWAVSEEGYIFHYNGYSWAQYQDEMQEANSSSITRSIWGVNDSKIWVGGWGIYQGAYNSAQVLWYFDGSTWENMYSYGAITQYTSLYDINGTSSNNVWFVGVGDRNMWHWNGVELTEQSNFALSSSRIRKIMFIDSDNGWGVCDDGIILRYSD